MSSADADTAEEVEAPETDEAREALLASFVAELGDAVVGSHVRPGDDLWLRVRTDAWLEAGRVARHKVRLDFFDFLSALDWLPSPFGRDMDSEVDAAVHGADEKEPPEQASGYAGGDTRFQVFARVASTTTHLGVTLKADVPDDALAVDSWLPAYAGVNWHEREAHEMFGITFTGHPYLRHLYLPGEFEGHPLRKDFPLLARRVKPWPGIVDVEPLPGSDDEDEEADA